jgi:peptidoglycan/LPS O-acetylase OafA/YrhL
MSGRAGFRGDIECLRGVAVLAVIFYHALPQVAPGGFVGVDIFFVISGFLISAILLDDLEKHSRIALGDFWARRARRILPAATLVLIATAVAIVLAAPFDFKVAHRDIRAAAAFVLNWQLAREAVDYLAFQDEPSVVLHYWSLSIEEQFYAIFPLLLGVFYLVLSRLGKAARFRQILPPVILVLWLASLAACVVLTSKSQATAFFNTGVRAWELLTGTLILLLTREASELGKGVRAALGIAGLAAIVVSIFCFSNETPYPGAFALAPTLGAAAVIAANWQAESPAGRTALFPLALAGRYSYAWYLWHWPVLMFGPPFLEGLTVPVLQLVLIAMSFLLAWATQTFVENPNRFSTALVHSVPSSLIAAAALISVGLAGSAAVQHFGKRAELTLDSGKTISAGALENEKPQTSKDGCHLDYRSYTYGNCTYGAQSGNRTVYLVGDSHAQQWFPALERAASDSGWRLVSRTKASCPVADLRVRQLASDRHLTECDRWRDAILKEIEADKPDAVFIGSFYELYVKKLTLDPTRSMSARQAELEAALVSVARRISKNTGTLFLFRDTPKFDSAPVHCIWQARGVTEKCHWNLAERQVDIGPREGDGLDWPANAVVVDLNASICPKGVCHAVQDGFVVMRNKDHVAAKLRRDLRSKFQTPS